MGRRDNKRSKKRDDENLGTLVSTRHRGRLYQAEVLRNGSTTVTRDGVWLCNGDWNGRALDTGLHELHEDPGAAEEILVALRNQNRFRKVKFNTIALVFGKSKIEKAWKYEDPGEMGAFMRRIAEETGGESVVIDRPFFDLKD